MRKKRAIIYDDEPFILRLLEQILLDRDYEVVSFSEPVICPLYREERDSCKNMSPCADILITDRNMPELSDIELLMRQYDRECQMDIRNKAVISGDFSPDDLKLIDYIGFKVLNKPFTYADITAWLEECERRIDLTNMVGVKRRHDRRPVDYTNSL